MLFAWIGQRRLIQEPLILHENVAQFPLEVLEAFLGDIYILSVNLTVLLWAYNFGNPYDRRRRWTYMPLKRSIVFSPERTLVPPLEEFVKLYRRMCQVDLAIYLWMDDNDEELQRSWRGH